MKTFYRALFTIMFVFLIGQMLLANQLEGDALRKNITKNLSNLNDKKLNALMERVGKKVPKNFYNCLCKKDGGGAAMGVGVSYHPEILEPYSETYSCNHPGPPCMAQGYGCWRFPLPNDPKDWNYCIEHSKYDDNSTIVDAIYGAMENLHNEQKGIKIAKSCPKADALKMDVQKLKNERLNIKSQVEALEKEKDGYLQIYKTAKEHSEIAKEWIALAKKEKKRFEEARDECLALKNLALSNAMIDFYRKYGDMIRESQESFQNNKSTIEKNNTKIEKLKTKIQKHTDSINNAHKNDTKKIKLHTKHKPETEAQLSKLKKTNSDLAMPDSSPLSDSLSAISQTNRLKETIIEAKNGGSLNADNASDREYWDEQTVRNEYARLVAEKLFLGMERSVLESMNAEAILTEMTPALKAKRMEQLAKTYDDMAKGIDEVLDGHIMRQMPETKDFADKVDELNSEIVSRKNQIKSIEEEYREKEALYKKELNNCANYIITP